MYQLALIESGILGHFVLFIEHWQASHIIHNYLLLFFRDMEWFSETFSGILEKDFALPNVISKTEPVAPFCKYNSKYVKGGFTEFLSDVFFDRETIHHSKVRNSGTPRRLSFRFLRSLAPPLISQDHVVTPSSLGAQDLTMSRILEQ